MHSYTYLFVGPPGSGKGTQAGLVADRLGIAHLDVGSLLRERALTTDQIGQQIMTLMKAGKTVPEQLVLNILLDHLKELDLSAGVVLDGYCRTRIQVNHLIDLQRDGIIPPIIVISIEVPDQELLQRITEREYCVIPDKEPKLIDADFAASDCLNAGGKIVKRADDNQTTFKQRLKVYQQQTLPAITELAEHWHRVVEVDGTQPISDVAKEIQQELTNLNGIN